MNLPGPFLGGPRGCARLDPRRTQRFGRSCCARRSVPACTSVLAAPLMGAAQLLISHAHVEGGNGDGEANLRSQRDANLASRLRMRSGGWIDGTWYPR